MERATRFARLLAIPLGSALLSLVVVGGVLTLAGYRLVREPQGGAAVVTASAVAGRTGVASAPVAATPTTAPPRTPTTMGGIAVVTGGPGTAATATPVPTPTALGPPVGTVIVSTALASNRYVVTRTAGVGVVFREAPSPTAPVIVLIMEGEEVNVTAPPVDANGYIWYPVQRDGRAGFIRAEFLASVRQQP